MLGNINLFTSHFIMGCVEAIDERTKTKTDEIISLHNWLNFKDNEPHMERYCSKRTQYVCFLRIIPLDDFRGILFDLSRFYKRQYPFSTKPDFIKNIFETTIFEIRELIKWIDENKITWLSEPPNESKYSFYTVFSSIDSEFFDFAILSNFDIQYYKQYYSRILEMIDSIEYEFSELHNVPTQRTNTTTNPFKDDTTAELFEYIETNWSYDKQQKWADIYNEINESGTYKIPYSGDYEKYIRKRFNYLGKFQYENDKRKKLDNKDRQSLIKLIREFSKK
jgi:hypothetical protein